MQVSRALRAPVLCRPPVLCDGAEIHALIRDSGSLDLNSAYSYLLLATHFADTCSVATCDGRLVGFTSGYLEPADPSVLFIWQVAVRADARGRGVARRLLGDVLGRPASAHVRFLEATVAPSNDASLALFRTVARERGATFERRSGFAVHDFGDEPHEPEELVRIGPLDQERSLL